MSESVAVVIEDLEHLRDHGDELLPTERENICVEAIKTISRLSRIIEAWEEEGREARAEKSKLKFQMMEADDAH